MAKILENGAREIYNVMLSRSLKLRVIEGNILQTRTHGIVVPSKKDEKLQDLTKFLKLTYILMNND